MYRAQIWLNRRLVRTEIARTPLCQDLGCQLLRLQRWLGHVVLKVLSWPIHGSTMARDGPLTRA